MQLVELLDQLLQAQKRVVAVGGQALERERACGHLGDQLIEEPTDVKGLVDLDLLAVEVGLVDEQLRNFLLAGTKLVAHPTRAFRKGR